MITDDRLKEIRALCEAGDKIRDDEFYCDTGDEVHNCAGCVFAYPKDEMFKDTNFANNSEFFVLAANARPAIKEILAEVERLREALRFYADSSNYTDHPGYVEATYSTMEKDYGQRARKVLGDE